MSCRSGINQWRDQLKPSQILQNLAKVRGVPNPRFEGDGSSLSFAGREYHLQEFGIAILESPVIIAHIECAVSIVVLIVSCFFFALLLWRLSQ